MAETSWVRSPAALWRSAAATRLRGAVLRWQVGLLLILLAGTGLRFHGLYWDQPAGAQAPLQMHPDERFLSLVASDLHWPSSIGGYFDTARSPLNPYNDPNTHSYVYGTFPLFLAKGAFTLFGAQCGQSPTGAPGVIVCAHRQPFQAVGNVLPGFADNAVASFIGKGCVTATDSYDGTVVCGRRITSLFDVATIGFVFALGWSLFGGAVGRKVGLLAALFYALAVLPTQLAHFWTMDPYVTFFGAATLVLSALLLRPAAKPLSQRKTAAIFVGLGVSIGLGLACKVTAWPLALAPVVAVAVRMGIRDVPRLGLQWQGGRPRIGGHWANDLSWLCLAAAISILVFRVAQPYAFTGPHFWDMGINPQWKADLQREINFENGNVDYPPFVQFAGRTAFLTPLRTMVVWGTGPALGIAAWLAIAAAGYLLFKRREMTFLLPLTFAGAIFIFQGVRFVAFMRYFVPMYPVLCLMAGWGLVALWRTARQATAPPSLAAIPWARLRRPLEAVATARNLRWVAGGAAAVVVLATAWWAMAFQAVYSQTNPRITASAWIYANVAKGSALTSELWDDSLPYALPGSAYNEYRIIQTDPYATDSVAKVHQLIYGRPEDNGLGGLDHANYVIISSDRVRESVQRLPAEYPATIRYYQLLDSGALGFKLVAHFATHPTFLGLSVNDSGAEESFTVYDHPEVRIYQKTGAWDPARAQALLDQAQPERAINLLPRQGRTNGLQFTPAEEAVQQAGGTFSDVFAVHGWTSHIPWLWWLVWLELAGLAAVPWVTWLFRALPDRGYGLSKLLGLVAVALPSWVLIAWGPSEFSFTLAWSVWGTMVAGGAILGHLRRDAIIAEVRRSWRTWLAVEGVFLLAFGCFLLLRYFNPDLWHPYQGGEKPMDSAFFTAVIRSTKLPPYDPWFAGGTMNYSYMGWFFLAVPVRALKIVPEVAYNLGIPTFAAMCATVAFSTVHNLVAMTSQPREAIARRAGAVASAAWRPALIAGIFGALLLIGVANLDGAQQTIQRLQAVNHWSLASGVPFVGGVVGVFGGLARALFAGAALPPFDWWRSSRVHFGTFDITEFPFWSLLFGDLHPHLMDVPFFGLNIAMAIAYVVSVQARPRLRLHPWLLAAAIGVTMGLVRTVHTWDFPAAVIIGCTSIVLAQVIAEGRWQDRWWQAAGHLALAGGVMVVLFAPFTTHFETFDTGLVRAPQTTKLNQYFVQYGIFVGLALAFVAVRYHELLAERGRDHGRNPFLATVNGRAELAALTVFVAGLAAFTWTFGLATLSLAVLLDLFILNLLWLDVRDPERNLPRMLATAMFALAFGISAGVDVVTLKNDIVRMNTVFKFSLQAWQLFALGGAFAAWYVGRALWQFQGSRIQARPHRGAAAVLITAVLGALLVGSSIFLFSGTRAREATRFASLPPTLNGLAFMQKAQYGEDLGQPDPSKNVTIPLAQDTPLIDWLRSNVRGSPVIVEAVGPLYHWTGRMSEYTGLPAVIGWDWHEIQQRTDYSALVDQRRADTDQFYKTTDIAWTLQYLLKYNVSYVVVGTEEHAHGTAAGLAKFDHMPALTRVFTSGNDAIYRVDQNKLPQPTG